MQKLIIVQSGDVESSRTLGIFADKERALLFLKAKVKRDFLGAFLKFSVDI